MKRPYYGWVLVSIAMLVSMLVYGTTYHAFGLFVIPVSSEYGLSRADMNTAFVILEFGTAAMSPLVGRLLDFFPLKRIMFVSVLLLGFSFAVLGLSHSIWVSAAAIFLPLSAGMLGAAVLTMSLLMAHWFKAQRGRAMMISVMGVSLGGVVVSPVIAVLITNFGWRSALLIMAAAITILLSILILFIRERPGENDVETRAPVNIPVDPIPHAATADAKPLGIWTALRRSDFWAFSVAIAVAGSTAQTLTITLVPFAVDRGLTTVEAATIVSLFGTSAIAYKLLLAVVADKFDRITLLTAICLLGAVTNAALYVSYSYVALAACAVILGGAARALGPVVYAFVADRFGVQSFGTIRGLSGVVIAIVGAAFARFAGEVYDRTGSYDILFTTFILVDVIAAMLMISMRYTKPPLIRVAAA